MKHEKTQETTHWLDKPVLSNLTVSWESLIFGLILAAAVLSRFYNVGARVISHDETSHVYYAWRLFKGFGYSHDPITHGPLQFHLLALTYFIFGASDFSARIPTILAGIATIGFLWKYRRYLGRWGTLGASLMMLISPFMLYYSRYVRNEAYVALFGVVTLWSILRYLETRSPRFLYWLTAATMLHFTAKETAFIYTAQAMILLGLIFISRISNSKWVLPQLRNTFLILLIIAAIFMATAFVIQTVTPPLPETEGTDQTLPYGTLLSLGLSVFILIAALVIAIRGYTWKKLKGLPSFSAMLLLGTLVLPQLAPFPVRMLDWNPLDYSQVGMIRTGGFIILLTLISAAFGLSWNPRVWLICMGIFYIPFSVLYTTVFTNGSGFFTGLVGSLGYWLEQQGVERGSQPWYYYWLIQIPIYEYLPALGAIAAMIATGIQRLKSHFMEGKIKETQKEDEELEEEAEGAQQPPVFAVLSFWVLTSLIAYPIAGEKMPWLTVHITWPMILLAGWGFQKLVSHFDVPSFKEKRGILVAVLCLIFLISFSGVVGSLASNDLPFQGQELHQLRRTGTFFTEMIFAVGSGVGIYLLLRTWKAKQFMITLVLTALLILTLLTTHTSVQASYINYDSPEEYLVYAHSARGVKVALNQIEEISRRISDGLAVQVSFDNETTYPYWWYLRDYTNQDYYGENPTRKQRESPVILVGNDNYGKIEPVVGRAYYKFEYKRIVWPNQDYYNLTWERIKNALRNPAMREAIFQIWLNRDYTKYAQVKDKEMSLANWSPADEMRLYVRKDIAAKVWNLGVPGQDISELTADPYEGKEKTLTAERTVEQLSLSDPRNVAAAGDGSIYLADTGNNRVIHLSPEGDVLHTWGVSSGSEGESSGTIRFNEPWGIAVGPGGSVYVADTWNHRIQKFTAEGDFLLSWGQFGQQETPDTFWGPRDVAVDTDGHVYVSDTGNKRIAIFDENGEFLKEFGGAGLGEGQLDEPVGLALDENGNLYVADTWNQRVQVFEEDGNGIASVYKREWEIDGWYGQSLDNKPYLTVAEDLVFISDPEASRILAFSTEGEFLYYWGTFGAGKSQFSLPTGLAADSEGGLWVSDTKNNRLMYFLPPEE